MKSKTGNAYDIPIEGVTEHFFSMNELMDTYNAFVRQNNYENAKATIAYCAQCGHLPAKIELARFLVKIPQLRMSQQDRYLQAERLYTDVLNILDLPKKTTAIVSMELANLYKNLHHPVACLGALLKASRHGFTVPDEDLAWCRQKLNQLDINRIAEDPTACYLLGSELYFSRSSFKFTEIFLREAAEAGDIELAGRACLLLANLYSDNSEGFPNHNMEAIRYYRLAEKYGNPEVLSKKKQLK